MVRVITQQTFNEVVNENIEEFSMTPSEAVQDAVQQFEAQGVDLSNIIKSMDIVEGHHPLTISLRKIDKALAENEREQLLANLKILQEECNKDLASKILAGKEGAYGVCLDSLDKYNDDKEAQVLILQAMLALLTGYPDLLDVKGANYLTVVIIKNKDIDLTTLSLKICKECCIKHEKNRQVLHAKICANGLGHLIDSPATKEVCSLIRALCLDDDIRVQVSRAHEHARILAIDLLCPLTALLFKFKSNKDLVSDLLHTMSVLMVRNEFCEKVEEAGVLPVVYEILYAHYDEERVCRMCMALLKTLAGNDDVKQKIIENIDLIQISMGSIDRHMGSPAMCSTGLGLIAALALRSPANSKVLCRSEGPLIITAAMKQHPFDVSVQRRGCWAIRNIVSRSRELCTELLKVGAEEILLAVMARHKDCVDDAKAALRDLGCSVKLVEQWKGTGTSLKDA